MLDPFGRPIRSILLKNDSPPIPSGYRTSESGRPFTWAKMVGATLK
jgi:hypothetical protein